MNLNHLRAFVKVVQSNSFREAAHQLKVSQPAITQRIKSLEDTLGTKLLNRDVDGTQLTSAGKLVYEGSKTILRLWDELVGQLLGTQVAGKLHLGASTIPSEYFLPGIIKEYTSLFDNAQIQMRVSGSGDVYKWLLDRTIELAITGKPPQNPKIFSTPIFTDELQVIAPIDAEWANEVKTMDHLLEFEWIVREPESDTRKTFERELERANYPLERLKIVSQMGSSEAVIAGVEAGLGIAVVSSLAADRAVKYNRVKKIPIQGLTIHRTFYLSCLVENMGQPLLSSFIEYITRKFS